MSHNFPRIDKHQILDFFHHTTAKAGPKDMGQKHSYDSEQEIRRDLESTYLLNSKSYILSSFKVICMAKDRREPIYICLYILKVKSHKILFCTKYISTN